MTEVEDARLARRLGGCGRLSVSFRRYGSLSCPTGPLAADTPPLRVGGLDRDVGARRAK